MSQTPEDKNEALRDAIRCCRCATELSPLPAVATEGERHIVRYANPAFCALAGRPSDDLIGRAFADIVPKTERNGGVPLLDKVYHTGEPEITKDRGYPLAGTTAVYWSYAAWALLDQEQHPAGVALQVTDITDATLVRQHCQQANAEIREINQKLLIATIREQEFAEQAVAAEQQLLQARKMEGIGRLAGGIAHDFNNLLTVILGFAELAAETLAPDAEAQGYLRNISTAAERGATLTNQLLAFARKQVIRPQIVDINALILDTDQMLRRLIGANISLVVVATPNVGKVRADPGQLGQILINLVVNARDAISDAGAITIETARTSVNAADVRRHPELTAGDYIRLSVRDTGAGISEELQPHLFEPFFTTKEQGKGTGLGLATCYGIVKQSGGHITVTSEHGKGTTFNIYLPRINETDETHDTGAEIAAATPLPSGETAALPGGTEIICLVEDEEMVREIGANTLRRQGYTVFEAANGSAALHLIDQYPGKIDLLITDVMMPQMGGIELADRLYATRPDIPVLFVSGYTGDATVHQGAPARGLVHKPFTAATLLHTVRDVLDGVAEETLPLARDGTKEAKS